MVEQLVARARLAQRQIDGYSQQQVDLMVSSVAWAILEPTRNRTLAEMAVRDTGLGDVDDKVAKNFRKTLGLLRDLKAAVTVGVVREDRELGITEVARPVGVVAAITPSTNPGATPINKILNALKCRNAIIVAPSPKGASTCKQLLGYVHAQLKQVEAPLDLVQMLPEPISKEATQMLLRSVDLVVATFPAPTPSAGVPRIQVARPHSGWALETWRS